MVSQQSNFLIIVECRTFLCSEMKFQPYSITNFRHFWCQSCTPRECVSFCHSPTVPPVHHQTDSVSTDPVSFRSVSKNQTLKCVLCSQSIHSTMIHVRNGLSSNISKLNPIKNGAIPLDAISWSSSNMLRSYPLWPTPVHISAYTFCHPPFDSLPGARAWCEM